MLLSLLLQYRNVVIGLFKSSSFLHRKQFLEEYSILYGHPANSKTLTAVLKVQSPCDIQQQRANQSSVIC